MKNKYCPPKIKNNLYIDVSDPIGHSGVSSDHLRILNAWCHHHQHTEKKKMVAVLKINITRLYP